MIRGMYVVASSAISENKRMDILANNIANVNTTGYKRDSLITESFPEILISKIGPNPIDKDVLAQKGSSGVDMQKEGNLYTAASKSGFFQIKTPLGVSNNKTITFKVDEEGYLVTPNKEYILGQDGPILVGEGELSIDNLGRIYEDNTEVGRLKVVNPMNSIGNFSYGIHIDEVATNYEQGQLNSTENPLDVAIQGNGFFVVEANNDERYTRNGEFTIDPEGYLVTKEGFKAMGENGYILLPNNEVSINELGEIISGDQYIDKLKMADFKDYKALSKEGNGLLKLRTDDLEENEIEFSGKINQGYIEASNVNSVKQMVEMITLLRSYEASQRLIRNHDELLSKAVNEVGRL